MKLNYYSETDSLYIDLTENQSVGLLNYSGPRAIFSLEQVDHTRERDCSKKSVQQGRSPIDARSVRVVREHGNRVRTPLVAFFNIPSVESWEVSKGIVLDYDAEGNLVGIDIDNASRKVKLEELTLNKLPASVHAIA